MIRKKILSILVLSLCVTAAAAVADAQGRYANVYTRIDVDNFIRNLENSSDAFSRDFKSRGGTSSNERRIVDRFENAVDRLRSRFNSSNSWWTSRNDVQGMMTQARQVNIMMNNERFARPLERQWRDLRRDINKLADTYELPDLGGQNGGGGYPGYPTYPGGGGNVPSWATGTFYGTDRRTGDRVMLMIQRNGSVTISVNGGPATYASLNGTTLTNGPYVSRISRRNNGLRTTDVNNGYYIDYYTSDTGGGLPAPGQGNVPNWAVGRFYGTNPQTGGTIELTVQRNGTVTIVMDQGSPIYASMNQTTLTNGPYVSRVTRLNNGIRTTDVSSGNIIDYYRR